MVIKENSTMNVHMDVNTENLFCSIYIYIFYSNMKITTYVNSST